ncbi:MAG: chalcone isomerase family protein [Polyangia bacterium]
MRQLTVSIAVVAALGMAAGARADGRDKDGYFETGQAVRTKKVAFVHVKVYDIKSMVKELPADRSKEGMIAADVAKKLSWKMLRTVDAERFRNALREGYAKNGYSDAGSIDKLLEPIHGEVKEGSVVTITYDAAHKRTTLYADGKQASVDGVPFMKATWSIWFGSIDDPSLPERLIQNLKKE